MSSAPMEFPAACLQLLSVGEGLRALGYAQGGHRQSFCRAACSHRRAGSREHQICRGHDGSSARTQRPRPQDVGGRLSNQQIEAMILLADDDEHFLLRQTRQLIDAAEGVATVLTVERGRVLRNNRGQRIEHFGYVDGRSQPLFSNTISTRNEGRGSSSGGILVPPWTSYWWRPLCHAASRLFRQLPGVSEARTECARLSRARSATGPLARVEGSRDGQGWSVDHGTFPGWHPPHLLCGSMELRGRSRTTSTMLRMPMAANVHSARIFAR